MSWNVCKMPECENWTYRPDVDYCESHRRANDKAKTDSKKQAEKRALQIQKANQKSKEPRKKISKNPADWSNTFLCSDGTRVTQAEIVERRNKAYRKKYPDHHTPCEACGTGHTWHHAHIIPQARCKVIGKTELIWHPDNFFRAHDKCNTVLENPKNPEWRNFKNIDKCLAFIKINDTELYTKFELSAVNQEKQTI